MQLTTPTDPIHAKKLSIVRELLSLAAGNARVYERNGNRLILGRARGYYLSAWTVFERLVDSGDVAETEFSFPSWRGLQSWAGRSVSCSTPGEPVGIPRSIAKQVGAEEKHPSRFQLL